MRATALPCKPYPEQHQLEQCGCPPGSERWLELYGNVRPRKIVVRDRTRLIDSLSANCAFRFSGTRFLHLLLRRYGSFSLSPRIGLEGRWRRWKPCFFSARQVRHSLYSAHWPRWRVFCGHRQSRPFGRLLERRIYRCSILPQPVHSRGGVPAWYPRCNCHADLQIDFSSLIWYDIVIRHV